MRKVTPFCEENKRAVSLSVSVRPVFFCRTWGAEGAAAYHVGDGSAEDFRFGAFRTTENDFSPCKMNRFPPAYAEITVWMEEAGPGCSDIHAIPSVFGIVVFLLPWIFRIFGQSVHSLLFPPCFRTEFCIPSFPSSDWDDNLPSWVCRVLGRKNLYQKPFGRIPACRNILRNYTLCRGIWISFQCVSLSFSRYVIFQICLICLSFPWSRLL